MTAPLLGRPGVPFLPAWRGPREGLRGPAGESAGRYIPGLTPPPGLDQARHAVICSEALGQALGPDRLKLIERIERDPGSVAFEVMAAAEEARRVAKLLETFPARINAEIAGKAKADAAAELARGAPHDLDPGARAQWLIDAKHRAEKPVPTLADIIERLKTRAGWIKDAAREEIDAALEREYFAGFDIFRILDWSARGELGAAVEVMLRNSEIAGIVADVLQLQSEQINRLKATEARQRWPEPRAAVDAVRSAMRRSTILALRRGEVVMVGRFERPGAGIDARVSVVPPAEWVNHRIRRDGMIEFGADPPRRMLHDPIVYRAEDAPSPSELAAAPGAPAPARPAFSAGAEAAACKWFLQQLREGRRLPTKDLWNAEMLALWPAMTGEAWLRIWSIASDSFPEISGGGRRRR